MFMEFCVQTKRFKTCNDEPETPKPLILETVVPKAITKDQKMNFLKSVVKSDRYISDQIKNSKALVSKEIGDLELLQEYTYKELV